MLNSVGYVINNYSRFYEMFLPMSRAVQTLIICKNNISRNYSDKRLFIIGARSLPLKNVNFPEIKSFSTLSPNKLTKLDYFIPYNSLNRNLSIAVKANKDEFILTRAKGKLYFELENDVFHSYFENNPNYNETILKNDIKFSEYEVSDEEFNNITKIDNWTTETADNYFISFIKVATYCTKSLQPISDPMFTSLCNAFPSKSIHFSDEQLFKCFVYLKNWPEAPSVRDDNFVKVWKALDSVCIMKRMNWNLKTTLLMMDLWYSLKLTRLSNFVKMSVLKCVNKARRLTQYDLVQLMFYINTIRNIPRGESSYELEYQLTKVIHSLTIEEIGIVCAGFFKSQSNISSVELINNIILILCRSLENINPVILATILKLIRYTHKDGNIEAVIKMFDSVMPIINNYPLQVFVHLALVCELRNISHPALINNLIYRFLSSPGDARLKDMEIIAKLVTIFEVNCKELGDQACQLIISEIESDMRAIEVTKYSKSLIRCLSYLSLKKFFSEKFSSIVLNDDFLHEIYESKYNMEWEVLVLDQNISLEFPEYQGSRLSSDLANYLSKKYSVPIPGTFSERPGAPYAGKFLQDLMITMRALSNDRDDFWHCSYFLPHFCHPDLLLHVDEKNQLLKITPEIKNRKYFTGYIKPPHTSGRWLLFIKSNRQQYTTDNQLTGEQICKIRQLRLLGYTPIFIPFNEFSNKETPDQKLDYIKAKIEALKV